MTPDSLIGQSPQWRAVMALAQKYARSPAAVLITGETGTGKERLARWIHQQSAVQAGPFVAVNCAAIPKELAESELFGHERGAFTGAVNRRLGKCRSAHLGTLFLDEIGEMDPALQGKLLRVLQDGDVEPLGSDKPVPVDIRIIAATNRNLEDAIQQRCFREDLWYRLNVLPVVIPPLRERTGDVALLVDHFLAQQATLAGGPPVQIAASALAQLTRYRWPGNIRELENVMTRVCLLQPYGFISLGDLPACIQLAPGRMEKQGRSTMGFTLAPDGINLPAFFDLLRKDLIDQALDRTKGNHLRAAQLLNIQRQTLYAYLRKWRRYTLRSTPLMTAPEPASEPYANL